MTMSRTDIQFQIDQLRKDKIIYALESIATTISSVFAIFVAGTFNLDSSIYVLIIAVLGVGGIGYWFYAMVGNFFRLRQIRKLESLL